VVGRWREILLLESWRQLDAYAPPSSWENTNKIEAGTRIRNKRKLDLKLLNLK
jgi:hypothetical protein